jgi:hypothetical protein
MTAERTVVLGLSLLTHPNALHSNAPYFIFCLFNGPPSTSLLFLNFKTVQAITPIGFTYLMISPWRGIKYKSPKREESKSFEIMNCRGDEDGAR